MASLFSLMRRKGDTVPAGSATSGFSDFWNYIREDRPGRWTGWVFAVGLAAAILYMFGTNLFRPVSPKAELIYIENWSLNRTDAEIRADRIARAKEMTRRNAEERVQFQRIADRLGIAYDSTEADRQTEEVLGKEEADRIKQAKAPPRSTLAERAARGPVADAPNTAPVLPAPAPR